MPRDAYPARASIARCLGTSFGFAADAVCDGMHLASLRFAKRGILPFQCAKRMSFLEGCAECVATRFFSRRAMHACLSRARLPAPGPLCLSSRSKHRRSSDYRSSRGRTRDPDRGGWHPRQVELHACSARLTSTLSSSPRSAKSQRLLNAKAGTNGHFPDDLVEVDDGRLE